MKLAFIGIGKVGFALAQNFQRKGHEIIIGQSSTRGDSAARAKERNKAFSILPLQKAVDQAEVVFLATPFQANEEVLKPLQFSGKPLVDCTNPVGAGISHGLESKVSGAEKVQQWASDASVVKAYSIYGFENLENPVFPDYNVKPVMTIAGNDHLSKQIITSLNTDLGFETLDVGDLSQALHLEHMTLLWVKMVRANGHNPNFTWAYLKR
jgi:predicted dinucleotide-binding enzyme